MYEKIVSVLCLLSTVTLAQLSCMESLSHSVSAVPFALYLYLLY